MPEIARNLGISKRRVQWYLEWALEETLNTPEHERLLAPVESQTTPKPKKVPLAPLTPTGGATVISATSTSILSPVVSPVDPEIQKQAFFLRTNGVPIDEIAHILDITPATANEAVLAKAEALNRLQINDVEVSRRVQLEQIDRALRGIMPSATGITETGAPCDVNMEAIDRMIRLLDMKAKLMGLNAPQRVDIQARLELIAKEQDFDVEDLRAILVDVIRDYPQLTGA